MPLPCSFGGTPQLSECPWKGTCNLESYNTSMREKDDGCLVTNVMTAGLLCVGCSNRFEQQVFL